MRRPEATCPRCVDLLNACDEAETGTRDTSSDDVEGDWKMQGFELATDAWVAVAGDGRLVGYAYTGDQHRTGELEADLWTHPQWPEPGLPARLLGLAERRAGELAAERAYPNASVDVFCIAVNRTKRELLRRHGFELRRTIYRMAADLPSDLATPPGPEGIVMRQVRPDADDRVLHQTMTESFTDHFRQSNEPFEAWRERLLSHADFDPTLWFIAWDGDEAAGAVIAYDHHDLGWVQGLGVRRPWRRRGIGGALLAHAFAALAARGQLRVELGVDAEGETQPLALYERAGMRLTFAYELFEKSLG